MYNYITICLELTQIFTELTSIVDFIHMEHNVPVHPKCQWTIQKKNTAPIGVQHLYSCSLEEPT